MTMPAPLISIAVCTYNGAQFLSEQLESILCQSYSNLEVIIVDDLSTDETWNTISRYADKDPRIKIYQNSLNLGYNKNFEKAISLTTGDFIALSDQDDVWYEDKVGELYNAIGDNWVVFSNSNLINSEGELLESSLLNYFTFDNQSYESLLLNNFVTGHTTLIARAALDYILPLPQKGFYDWWIGFISIYHSKLTYLNKILTKYRVHSNSVIQRISSVQSSNTNQDPELKAQLTSFSNYPNLRPDDRRTILDILQTVRLWHSGNSIPLLKLIVFKYPKFFSHKKPRRFISRINFARKFIKTL